MTTLPQISSLASYGGVLTDAVPVEDPTIEISADSLNALRNDVSGLTATCPRLIFQYTGSAGTPAITVSATWATGIDSVWGNNVSFNPIFSRTGTGAYTVQLPSSVPNQLGDSILLSVRSATGNITSGTTPGDIICNITSASIFTIKQYGAAGTPSDLVGSLIFIQVF